MANTMNYSIYSEHQSSNYLETRASFSETAPAYDSSSSSTREVQATATQPPPLPPPPAQQLLMEEPLMNSLPGNVTSQQFPIPPPLPHQSNLMMMNGSSGTGAPPSAQLGSISDQMSMLSGKNLLLLFLLPVFLL